MRSWAIAAAAIASLWCWPAKAEPRYDFNQIRRALHSLSPVDAIQVLLKQIGDTKTNAELIQRTR